MRRRLRFDQPVLTRFSTRPMTNTFVKVLGEWSPTPAVRDRHVRHNLPRGITFLSTCRSIFLVLVAALIGSCRKEPRFAAPPPERIAELLQFTGPVTLT